MDNLPPGVREQIELAESLMGSRPSEGNPPQDQTEITATEQPPAEPVEQTASEEKAAEPVSETPQESTGEDSPPQDAEYWKNRFKTIDGKYKAEVPRMAEQIRSLKTQVQELEADRRKYKAKADAMSEFFDEDDTEEVDAKATELEKAQAEKDEIEKIKRENAEVKRANFFKDLDAAIPSWRAIDESEAFTKWLSTIEPYSRQPFGEMLNQSLADNNPELAILVFNTYMQSGQGANPNRREDADEGRVNANRIEDELMPGNGRPSAADLGDGQDDLASRTRIWRRHEIDKFFVDSALPHRPGSMLRDMTPEQIRAIEQAIFWAQKEGRVTA